MSKHSGMAFMSQGVALTRRYCAELNQSRRPVRTLGKAPPLGGGFDGENTGLGAEGNSLSSYHNALREYFPPQFGFSTAPLLPQFKQAFYFRAVV